MSAPIRTARNGSGKPSKPSRYKYDSHTRLQLEGKDQMRARGVPSPDEWDAVALTFAEPVSSTPSNFNRKIEYPKVGVA